MANERRIEGIDELVTLTMDEVARVLKVHPRRAYQLAQRGEIPGVIRLGRSIRVHAKTLLQWLGRSEVKAA